MVWLSVFMLIFIQIFFIMIRSLIHKVSVENLPTLDQPKAASGGKTR